MCGSRWAVANTATCLLLRAVGSSVSLICLFTHPELPSIPFHTRHACMTRVQILCVEDAVPATHCDQFTGYLILHWPSLIQHSRLTFDTQQPTHYQSSNGIPHILPLPNSASRPIKPTLSSTAVLLLITSLVLLYYHWLSHYSLSRPPHLIHPSLSFLLRPLRLATVHSPSITRDSHSGLHTMMHLSAC